MLLVATIDDCGCCFKTIPNLITQFFGNRTRITEFLMQLLQLMESGYDIFFIGPVPKKHSDTIWKRFISACDYFFEQKNKATSSQRSVELENMEKKKEIITSVTETLEYFYIHLLRGKTDCFPLGLQGNNFLGFVFPRGECFQFIIFY